MTQQYVRTYAKPVEKKEEDEQKSNNQKPVPHLSNKQRAINEILKPFGVKKLVFDTETTTDEKQRLRFGFFMVLGLSGEEAHSRYERGVLKPEDADMLRAAGFFYNPAVLTEEEIALLKEYAEWVTLVDLARLLGVECRSQMDEESVKLFFLPVAEFVRFFYALQKRDEYVVMGHDLPFHLSRLATDWVKARGKMTGGFSLKLCDCKYMQEHHCPNHPNIRIKHISSAKNLIYRSWMSKNSKTRFCAVHFLDIQTLSGSLLDDAYDLDALGEILLPDEPDRNGKARPSKLRKRSQPDERKKGSNLSIQDIIYNVQDVLCTYACYRELRQLYLEHEIDTPMWELYSSSSVGKAHLKMFGVKPFLEAHPDFPPEVIGYSMIAYYGARNEIGVRLQPVEVMYLDFLSQYTTASALMKLQDILLAESISVEENTSEVQELLNKSVDELLQELAHPDFWPTLRCFILIKPDGDRLPFRGDYSSESKNVAIPYVKSTVAVWYTLADVIASKLLTDTTPIIEKSLCIVPSEKQYSTYKRKLFGHEIDLSKQDLFTELINVRNDKKEQLKGTSLLEQKRTLLESEQKALKYISSATSYGIMVELNQDEEIQEEREVIYYDIYGEEQHTKVKHVERPGKYFAGPIGAFIPAAGRLMLAIAERLGRDRGLSSAMMDTDAIAFVRPDDMAREDFRKRVLEVRNYFTNLSPYKGKIPILKIEKVNYDDNDKLVPLYFLGVSSKRYVLWQETEEGKIRIVKFSSHALGGLYKPYEDTKSPFTDIPEPYKDVQELGGARWVYDLWYRFIYGFKHNVDLDGVSPLKRDPKTDEPQFTITQLPQLQIPRFYKLTLSTWNLYETYAKREGREGIAALRPFNFISILPSHTENSAYLNTRAFSGIGDVDEMNKRRAFIEALNRPFYAPFATSPDDLHDIRCLDAPYTNKPKPEWFKPLTVGETLLGHFTNKERKADNGDRTGFMKPRTMEVLSESDIIYVGKEINTLQAAIGDETDYLLGDFKVLEYNEPKKFVDWKEVLASYHIADIVVATGVHPRAIQAIKSGKRVPSPDTETALKRGYNLLAENKNFSSWRDIPAPELTYLLEVDSEQLMRLMHGKQGVTAMQRRMILHKMGISMNDEETIIAVKEENRRKLEKALSNGSVKNIIHARLLDYPRARIESVLPHVRNAHPDGHVLSKPVIQPIFEEVKAEMKAQKLNNQNNKDKPQ